MIESFKRTGVMKTPQVLDSSSNAAAEGLALPAWGTSAQDVRAPGGKQLFPVSVQQLPLLAKEPGQGDVARPAWTGRLPEINHRIVRQLGHLASIVQIIKLALGWATVQDDIAGWVQRIGIDRNQSVS